MPQLTSIVDTSNKVPRAFVRVALGAGPRSPGSSAMKILLIGSKTSTGTAAVTTKYQIAGPDDAKTYFGVGSELHLAAVALFKANPFATVFACALDDSSGGLAATKTLLYTSGPATADGTITLDIMGVRVVVGVTSGQTVTQIGDAVVAALNGRTDCPVTGVNTAGSVALSSRNKGVRFNTITTRSLLTGATGVAHTPITGVMAGGTDTGANATTILDSLAAERFHFIVNPYTDSTNLLKFKTYATAQMQPLVGKRARWFACLPGTIAADTTISDAVNDPLGEVIQFENPDDLPLMIAASAAGAVAAVRSSDRAYNTDGLTLPGIKVQFAQADVMTDAELNVCLNNGLTPLLSRDGSVFVVREVTNYHNDAGGNDDFSILDTHYVDVAFFVADSIEQNFPSTFAGFKLAPDPTTGDAGPPAPKVATPSSIKGWAFSIAKAQENKLLVNLETTTKAGLVCELDVAAAGRANLEMPIDCIELFHQLAAQVSQVG